MRLTVRGSSETLRNRALAEQIIHTEIDKADKCKVIYTAGVTGFRYLGSVKVRDFQLENAIKVQLQL